MFLLQTDTVSKIEVITQTLLQQGAHLGLAIIKAVVIYAIGHLLIKVINKLVRKVMVRRNLDPSVRSFIGSLVNVVLIVLLIISIIGVLGIQTTSFAALLASVGIALGAALSGNLSNFAGGLIILLFKPFKVGDYISTKDTGGTVSEIQIFHTVLTTPDNVVVYVPNGTLSSGLVNNFNVQTRRVEWIIGVDYGEDYDKVKSVIEDILSKEERILRSPSRFIALHQLADSSVNIVIRAWVKASDYWDVYFNINKEIYSRFNEEGIDFPFPQMTVHQVEKS
ncbi:MAG: mechanosensitive ion channel [Dysgonomonas sp.]|nr:mechanosensitive ion channel [Dysgonomonas sp.]